MLGVKLRSVRQHLRELFEGVGQKIRLAVIVTGKRMCSLDDPIHVVRHMVKEPFAISRFQVFENLANVSSA
jgi:hypothetical protein